MYWMRMGGWLLVVFIAGCSFHPTVRNVVAAMPDAAESVLVVNDESLVDSAWKDTRGKSWPGGSSFSTSFALVGPGGIDARVISVLNECSPRFTAVGGSDFKVPNGLGPGKYKRVAVIVTADSTTPARDLLEQLADQGTVTRDEYRGHTLFSGVIPDSWPDGHDVQMVDVFLGFAKDNVTFITASRDDLMTLLDRFERPAPTIPTKWRAAARGIDWDAPYLVVRRLARPTTWLLFGSSPDNIMSRDVPIESFALWASRARMTIIVQAITTAPDDAVQFFQTGQALAAGMAEPMFTWKRQNTVGGFKAAADFVGDREQFWIILLIFITQFGTYFVI